MFGRSKSTVGLIALAVVTFLVAHCYGGTADKKAAAAWSWRDGEDLDACRLAWNQAMPCACDGKSPDCPCKPHKEDEKPAEPVSVAKSLDEAMVIAIHKKCPIVAFYNQPARAIRGAIAYRVNPPDGLKGVWVGGIKNGIISGFEVAANASDDEISNRFNGKAQPAQPVIQFFQQSCPGGNCGAQWN